MMFNFDTPFMEAFEELDKLNEAIDPAASKKFWAAAKANKIDAEAFHTAYDDELKELGLMDVFTAEGAFTNKGIYGRIKAAKEANPDSWAVKALSRLWALRYVDNVKFPSELAAAPVTQPKVDPEQQNRDRCDKLSQEYMALMPDALKAVDQEVLTKYKTLAGITEADFKVTIIRYLGKDTFNIHMGPTGYFSYQDPNTDDKLTVLTSILNRIIKKEILLLITKEFNDKTTNVFAADKYATAILLGESGTLYEVTGNYRGDIVVKANGSSVGSLDAITEPYEVIYTCTSLSNGNNSTRQDTKSAVYYSWNSKYADKLGNKIPTKFEYKDGFMGSYTETKKVENPSSKYYSHADGIDSWAEFSSLAVATD